MLYNKHLKSENVKHIHVNEYQIYFHLEKLHQYGSPTGGGEKERERESTKQMQPSISMLVGE